MINEADPRRVMDQLLADFKCAICLEVYVDATRASCGHTFCHLCISKWAYFTPKCPECHQPVNELTPMKNIDCEVDGLFQQLPLSIQKERDQIKEHRHTLEVEGLGNIEQPSSLLERLRSHTNRSSLTLKGQQIPEKLSEYLKEYPDSIMTSDTEKLQLPPLVNSADKSKGNNVGNSNKENVVKLPPINRPLGGRNARGITTTTCAQYMADKFPKGMEGDISTESTTEENIRELERRNKILEEQLFGTYDRIMSAIQDSDNVVAERVDPKVFGTPGFSSGSEKQAPSFSKETMIPDENQKMRDAEKQAEQTQVEDLIAETEELMEIENFLKKYPFERISNDDTLINFDFDEDDLNDMNLDMLDAETLEEIAAHRAKKGSIAKKPLSEAQQEIENFYKKLESKQQQQQKKQEAKPQAPPRIPKAVTELTTSAKLKRMPTLGKFGAGPPKIPSTTAAIQSHEKLWAKPNLQDKHPVDRQGPKTSFPPTPPPVVQRQNSKSSLSDQRKLSPAAQAESRSASKTPSKSSVHSATSNAPSRIGSKEKIDTNKKPSEKPSKGLTKNNNRRQPFSLDGDDDLSYEDFLKLEIDFLDGSADWKDFERPPEDKPARSYPTKNRNPDAFKQIQEKRARQGGATGSLPYRANGRQFPGNSNNNSNLNTSSVGNVVDRNGGSSRISNLNRNLKNDRFASFGGQRSGPPGRDRK